MEFAKITSKGQITIPIQIRKKLKLKEGDKVFFYEEKGKIILQNASQVALATFQKKMTGEAVKVGFESEKDVVNYIKEIRKLEVKEKQLILKPIDNKPRAGWEEALKEMSSNNDDSLLIPDIDEAEDFEWKG